MKLKDGGTIFYDHSQDVDVVGTKIAKCERTPKVTAALKAGLLIEVSEAQYKAQSGEDTAKAAATGVTTTLTKAQMAEILQTKYGIVVEDLKNTKSAQLQAMLSEAASKASLESAPAEGDPNAPEGSAELEEGEEDENFKSLE